MALTVVDKTFESGMTPLGTGAAFSFSRNPNLLSHTTDIPAFMDVVKAVIITSPIIRKLM